MDLFDKLMASAKADQLPTMTQIYSNRLSWYVSKGLVADLTPYMEDEQTGFTEEDLADIPEMFLAAVSYTHLDVSSVKRDKYHYREYF